MTTWDLVSTRVRERRHASNASSRAWSPKATGKPIRTTTLANPSGFGLGDVFQITYPLTRNGAWY